MRMGNSPLNDLCLALQPGSDSLLKVGAERSSSREDVTEGREVVLVDDGVFSDSENNRRDETSCCASVFLNELESRLKIEFWKDANCATVVEGEVETDLQRKNVVHRQDG